MELSEPEESNATRISIQAPDSRSSFVEESLREKINDSLLNVSPHHETLHKGLFYETGWISHKTVTRGDQRDKLFLDNVDAAVLYPKGILPTFTKRCFRFVSQVWWTAVNGAASCAYLPVILVAGGALFNFIPDDTSLVFIPLALMTPSFMHQGAKFVESMRQLTDPQGLKSIKPRGLKVLDIQDTAGLFQLKDKKKATEIDQLIEIGTELTKDTEAYLHPHKDLNFHRFLSLSFAVWENWKYALFFWYIERYTYDTRLWRSIFLPSYIIQSVAKDSEYFMNYFEKENTKSENEAFRDPVNLEKKKVLLDRLRITKHFINGPESDALVDAMHQALDERKNKIRLLIIVRDALIGHDFSKLSQWTERNQIIQEAIFEYIKTAIPTFNKRWEASVHSNIKDFLDKRFNLYVGHSYHLNINSCVSKIYSFATEQILFLKVQNALEGTFKDKVPTWNEALEDAVFQYLNETREGKSKSETLKTHLTHLKNIIKGNHDNKMKFFMAELGEKIPLKRKEICFENLAESAVSLFLCRPEVAFSRSGNERKSLRESNIIGRNLIEDLKFQSSKSTVKPIFQEASKVFLSFNSLLRFICTFWASKLVFEFTGADPKVSFYMSLVVAGVDSVFGIIKNWYPQQQEFADIRELNSQRDFKYCRWGSNVIFACVPAALAAMATAGMVWTELENSTTPWLMYLILIRGMPTEFMSQVNFYGAQVNDIVTSIVTQVPMPACLKTAQNRAILNRDLKNVEHMIERLAERSTERYYEIWSMNGNKEARLLK